MINESPKPDTERSLDQEVEEPRTDPAIRILRERVEQSFEQKLKKHDDKLTWRSIAVAVGGVAATVVAGLLFIDNRVAAQTDAGVKVHESRITALEQQVPQLRQEVFETRSELRELYKAVVEKKRSERLETPVPPIDGGHP